MRYEPVWTFNTARFRVELALAYDYGHQYDGDDADGETQAKLDSGEYVAFDSRVRITLDGVTIGEDHLGASVYDAGDVADFWTAHRDRDPMNRNCSVMRAAWRGEGNPDAKVSICHYFPGMIAEAIAEARKHLAGVPKMRVAA